MNGLGEGVRPPYRAFAEWIGAQKLDDLKRKASEAETLFRRTGITFAVYGDEDAAERLIPFDIIPRIISARRVAPPQQPASSSACARSTPSCTTSITARRSSRPAGSRKS